MNRVKIEYRRLTDLHPYENNPRNNDAAVSPVAASMHDFKFNSPIVIDKNDVIVCGHTRYAAAKSLGLIEVPTIRADWLTPDQIRAFRLVDNRVAEFSSWDTEKLSEELANITIDMTRYGFEPAEVKEDNYSEVPPKKPITENGDIWLLGRHRLMCGDSTNVEDVQTLMNGIPVDCLVTDPPYNVDYESNGCKVKMKIMNDSMPDDKFRAFLTDAFSAANEVMKPGAAFYIWHADGEGYNFRAACENVGWPIMVCLEWVKNSPVLGRQDYQWQHEPCLMGFKPGGEPLWVSDGKPRTSILRFNRPTKSKEHPTMKPVLLFDYIIRQNTQPMDVVLDVFGGSGTTIIACEQNDRVGYSMELDPHYADVIVDRYIKLVGDDTGVYLLRKGERLPYANVKKEVNAP